MYASTWRSWFCSSKQVFKWSFFLAVWFVIDYPFLPNRRNLTTFKSKALKLVLWFYFLRKNNPNTANPAAVPNATSPPVTTPEQISVATTNPVTQVSIPATPLQPVPEGEALPKYRRDLVAKQKVLRAELTALQPQSGHCRLEVSRTEIFEVCFIMYFLISLKLQFMQK